MSDIFQQLGIVRWVANNQAAASQPQQATVCVTCGMQHDPNQAVVGIGNRNANLMVVYEATEPYEGQAAVEASNQLLTAMLKAIGFSRDDVYIAYILKCEQQLDITCYTSSLQEQVSTVKPKLILATGNTAAHYLLNTQSLLESLRSKLHKYGNQEIPLVVTYHPAYLLVNTADKKKAFADLQLAARNL